MKILKTKYFKDVSEFVYCVLDQYETYEENTRRDDFLGVGIVAPYEVLIEVLNYVVQNTSFTMKNIHLEDGMCRNYCDEWILTIDTEGYIWTQVAKCESGYFSTEYNVVFVHGDVNSIFVKKNEKENLVAFEIGEVDDIENDEIDALDRSDSEDIYHVTVKCDLDVNEALKIIEDMEKRIARMNDTFSEMDRFRRLFQW